jgi:RimJ/RimL family protein N-acetyltransferase
VSGEPPVIVTGRLIVRSWLPGEEPLLHAVIGDAVTMHAWPAPLDAAQASRWVEVSRAAFARDGTGRFALVSRASGEIVGDARLVRATIPAGDVLDIGWIVHHPFWRRGYGYEAAAALRRYAFAQLGEPAVHAHMADDNAASWRLAEKLGMERLDDFPWERDRGKIHRLYVSRNQSANA